MIGLLWWILAGLAVGAVIAWTVIDDWVKQNAQVGDLVMLTKKIKNDLDTGRNVTLVKANVFSTGATKEFQATEMDDDLKEKFRFSDTYTYKVRG